MYFSIFFIYSPARYTLEELINANALETMQPKREETLPGLGRGTLTLLAAPGGNPGLVRIEVDVHTASGVRGEEGVRQDGSFAIEREIVAVIAPAKCKHSVYYVAHY